MPGEGKEQIDERRKNMERTLSSMLGVKKPHYSSIY